MVAGDSSLKRFGLLCQQVTAEPSLTIKEELIRGFIGRFTGDLGLLLKLLLPKNANRVYYTQEKQLLRVLSIVLTVPEDDLKNEWNRNGCIAETAQKYFKPHVATDKDGWCDMTLARFDSFLDQMAAASNEVLRVGVVRDFFQEACSHAVYLFFREIKLDLRLGAGLRIVLKGLHPSAYEIFQHCADVQEVVRRVRARGSTQSLPDDLTAGGLDDGTDGGGGTSTPAAPPQVAPAAKTTPAAGAARPPAAAGAVRRGAVAAQIKLGMPLAPMLAAPAKTVDQVLSKCPNGAFSEVKYDGERIQVHKHGGNLSFFARSLKPMRPDKFAGLESYLQSAIKADECILDGEILMVDINTSVPLPFGTLGKHKRTQFATACPCVFLFDILYRDGESLLQRPLEERREELKKAVQFTRNRVMFSELCLVKGDLAQRRAILQQHLNRAIAEGLEGLVIKDVKSVYEPRARHWIKLKKDYLDGLADSADLLVLGAWYGSGNKGGQLSTFLMGCIDTSVPAGGAGRYKTVCKVGNGLDDMAITVLSQKYAKRMSATAGAGAPSWLDCHSSHLPDMVVQGPATADVMEIIGAEFSITKTHTAGISIRFPRILRIRTDKNPDSATTLQELLQLFRTSKEKLSVAGVPDSLQLVDSYVIAPGVGGDGAGSEGDDNSNSRPPVMATAPPQRGEEKRTDGGQGSTGDSAAASDTTAAYTLAPGLVYVKGDATRPAAPDDENVVLCHCSAVGGVWSHRGFMGQVTRTFGDKAELAYAQSAGQRNLGDAIVTEVGSVKRPGRVFVATVMGQTTAPRGQMPPVDQAALRRGLGKCIAYAHRNNASLHIVPPPEETGVDWSAIDQDLLGKHACAGAGEAVRIVVYGAEPANRVQAPPPPHTTTTTTPVAPSTAPPRAPAPTEPSTVNGTKKRDRSPQPPARPAGADDKAAAPQPQAHAAAAATAPAVAGASVLPRSWWSLMHDVRAQVVGPDWEVQGMCVKVDMLGGKTVHTAPIVDAHVPCTHVIILAEAADAQGLAQVPQNAIAVTGQWVDDCLSLGTRYAEELYRPAHLTILAGCRLLLSPNLANRAEWERLAALLGATLHRSWHLLEQRSTHYISDSWDAEADKVFQLGGRVVSPQWLVDSAVAQAALPARAYLLPRANAKSGAAAAANPLEGVLCGLKICVLQGEGVSIVLAEATAHAVHQMGGEVVPSPADAQYCVISREAYDAQSTSMPMAVRFRCVAPRWLWDSARKRSLQDPLPYTHSNSNSNSKAGKTQKASPAKPPPPARDKEAAENAGGDDDADARSQSSYSTETYVEDEQEIQANGIPADADDLTEEEGDDHNRSNAAATASAGDTDEPAMKAARV